VVAAVAGSHAFDRDLRSRQQQFKNHLGPCTLQLGAAAHSPASHAEDKIGGLKNARRLDTYP
jgi:hypothetical protein